MVTVLVAGFGPFPGAPKNPSADLVRALARRRRPALADVGVVGAVLPTTYAAIELPALLKRYDPDLVLFFGLATRAKFVRIESRAVNAASLIHPDAHRQKLATRQIICGAPAELKVRASLQRIAAAIRAAGVTARHSRDAGRYICNAALFTGLDAARRTGRPKQVAFIHIP
ncbi:MAG: pyroglutamyl-peptidase I, partial [Xanthobacteraceae bacterium]